MACNIGALSRTFHDPAFIRRLLSYIEDTPAEQLGIVAIAAEAKPANLDKMWDHSRRAGIVPPKIV